MLKVIRDLVPVAATQSYFVFAIVPLGLLYKLDPYVVGRDVRFNYSLTYLKLHFVLWHVAIFWELMLYLLLSFNHFIFQDLLTCIINSFQ